GGELEGDLRLIARRGAGVAADGVGRSDVVEPLAGPVGVEDADLLARLRRCGEEEDRDERRTTPSAAHWRFLSSRTSASASDSDPTQPVCHLPSGPTQDTTVSYRGVAP